jgi:MFS family permease
VIGSLLFTALRRVALPVLLVVSTLAIGVAYLGMGAAPTLAVACTAAAVGGTGNGIQWVALVTAVQELTRATYQARVLALLEALASAMPGIGFLLGGAVAAVLDPRASFVVAGVGVLAVLALAIARLRHVEWRPELEQGQPPPATSVARHGDAGTALTGS